MKYATEEVTENNAVSGEGSPPKGKSTSIIGEGDGDEHGTNVVELTDVLVLSIENGRDFFLSVTAQFTPTIPGNYWVVLNVLFK